MIDVSSLSEANSLPPVAAGWFDYGYAALMDGRLALVRTRADFHTEHRRWFKAFQSGNFNKLPPTLSEDCLRISIFDGVTETDVLEVPSERHPIIDRMADGRWLIASARAKEGVANARFISPDGKGGKLFEIGDGIENLMCSPDGTFWVGYFDEGVFGGPNADGSWPASCGGIVQFNSSGKLVWSFNQNVPNTRMISDCYAMTLNDGQLWACYYTDFPIIRVKGGKITNWANSISGAKAIAVVDDVVVLAGGYGDNANRIAVLKIEDKVARHMGNMNFNLGRAGSAGLIQGRGSIMHIVCEGVWRKIPVHRLAQAF